MKKKLHDEVTPILNCEVALIIIQKCTIMYFGLMQVCVSQERERYSVQTCSLSLSTSKCLTHKSTILFM